MANQLNLRVNPFLLYFTWAQSEVLAVYLSIYLLGNYISILICDGFWITNVLFLEPQLREFFVRNSRSNSGGAIIKNIRPLSKEVYWCIQLTEVLMSTPFFYNTGIDIKTPDISKCCHFVTIQHVSTARSKHAEWLQYFFVSNSISIPLKNSLST